MDVDSIIEGILPEITPEMLRSPYNFYAKIIGVENLYRFSKSISGKIFYCPNPYTIFKDVIRQRIIDEHSKGGVSVQDLAEKYGLGKNTVQRYITEDRNKKRYE